MKRPRLAEAYGMGDVKIGLMTGQYPNPSFIEDIPNAESIIRTICGSRCRVELVVSDSSSYLRSRR